jgi:hypothetical protein
MKTRILGLAALLSSTFFTYDAAAQSSAATQPTPAATAQPPQAASAQPSNAYLRFMLAESAHQTHLRRLGEGAMGVAAAGGLIGVSFATSDAHPGLATGLWITSGVVGVASVLNWFLLSDLEKLHADAAQRSDAELYSEWRKIAQGARLERRFGAVLGAALGAASVIGGVVMLNGDGDSLSRDSRKIFGTALVAGGALSITEGVVHWIVPRAEERDFALAERASTPRVSMSFGAIPSGASLNITGAF